MAESTMVGGYKSTRENVERAFDVHKEARRIRDWQREGMSDGYRVTNSLCDIVVLKTLREAAIYVHALGSAAQRPMPSNMQEEAVRLSHQYTSQHTPIFAVAEPYGQHAFVAGFLCGTQFGKD